MRIGSEKSRVTSQVTKTVSDPRVSVVMVVGPDLRFLDTAVDSILRQDFLEFEFVIVNDGTGEDAVFSKLRQRDPRIRIITNSTNLGAAAAANRGIATANGDIIVRLDADDVAEQSRIRKLIGALDSDQRIGLVGSGFINIDETGKPLWTVRMPEGDLEIRWTIYFYNPFCHSSVAYRRRCFEATNGYRTDQPISHDHFLWAEMLEVTRACNLPEPLVSYRNNSRGLVASDLINWRARTHDMRRKLWAQFGLCYDLYDEDLSNVVHRLISGCDISDSEMRGDAYRAILKLLRAFVAAPVIMGQPRDEDAARRLAARTTGLILAGLPDELVSIFRVCLLTWRHDWRGTLNALGRSLSNQVYRYWYAQEGKTS
jgi:glycosyltransferase involved in cell wall biosynthesis